MSNNLPDQRILIIDFGSQYTQLIARRLRELGVYCEIYGHQVSDEQVKQFMPKGIILSGGPETVTAENSPRAPAIVFELNCPVLGICYGMQTMAAQLGGKVESSESREFGYAKLHANTQSALFTGCDSDFDDDQALALDVWMSHGDKVTVLPEGFETIGESSGAPHAAMANEKRRFYGVQFHPEVTHTKQGERLLSNFVYQICGCESQWTPANIIETAVTNIKQQVGSDQVILGLSGGVDSAVAAALLHRAIGDQLTCVFVDNGLLRLNEAEQVMDLFAEHLGMNVVKVDAADQFLTALKGVSDPEQKRKVIGNLFISVFDQQSTELSGVKWLAQGTIYPDVIESAGSATGNAHMIKSHHNVGGLPETMNLKLIEPLRMLFKDEVRKIGIELGLAESWVNRHPFPGPGLAVRVLGEVSTDYLPILKQADAIFIEALMAEGWYHKVAQAFAVFLPVKSVAVMGDGRCYDYVISLRAVETTDFMTARWARLPHEFLAKVSNRIINEVKGVSRVVYDISGKPPATIEWE